MALIKLNDRSVDGGIQAEISTSDHMMLNTDTFDYTGNNGIQIQADAGNNAGIFFNTDGDTVKGYVAADSSLNKVQIGSITNHEVNIRQNGNDAINIGNGRVAIQNQGTDVALQIDGGGDLRMYASDASTFADMWVDGRPTGSASLGSGHPMFMHELHLFSQHCTYDRSWNDNPSITVHNTTTHGAQGDFRIHGSQGNSGGDIAVNLVIDGTYQSSDERKKTNIADLDDGLDLINQLRPRKFAVMTSDLEIQEGWENKYGFIAQELQTVLPHAVNHAAGREGLHDNGWCDAYTVDYGKINMVAIKAIQELSAKIDDLTARIEALESA